MKAFLKQPSTPARSNGFSPIDPPKISELTIIFGKLLCNFCCGNRILRVSKNCHSRKYSLMLSHDFPLRAILASLFLATRTDTSASRARSKFLHFSNCQTGIVGNHNNARAFEDLAEFLNQFLFLGSIHSSSPVVGGANPSGSFLPH